MRLPASDVDGAEITSVERLPLSGCGGITGTGSGPQARGTSARGCSAGDDAGRNVNLHFCGILLLLALWREATAESEPRKFGDNWS